MIFELNTNGPAPPSIPEPAGFGLIGGGLLSIGLARIRARGNRA